ncbi:MAG: 30S ribosomal protein S18 [Candidatus Falkowbacteria bacterium]|nr:30S ribosomal protein S18 [Candidatus Falkowbacteria bacterium]
MQNQKNSIIENACLFCINNVKEIDYKNTISLSPFISSYKKILPSKKTKLCAGHQRKFGVAVKQARIMSLLPYSNN